jgi:outer membrane protein
MRRIVSTMALGVLPALAVGLPAQGTPQKVAIIDIQRAIAQSNDGQQAAKEMQAKFGPKRAELEKAQQEIIALEDQLRTQQTTLSEDARNRLLRSVDDKKRAFTRSNEDATAEWQQAEQDAINEIGQRMMRIISEHAQKSGYGLVVDVSSPQTPVLYAAQEMNITDQVIDLYNQSTAKPAAGAAAAPPAAPAATGTTPAPAGSAPPASTP